MGPGPAGRWQGGLHDLNGTGGLVQVLAGSGRCRRVVPGLNGLLAQMATLRAGNGVLALCELADELLQLTVLELLAADHGAQHGQAKQSL
jgi:hypothetical protein